MAQAGQKVLVLDADFRRPMQHKIFTLDRRVKGLSSVLAGEMTLEEATEHTGLENLDILTCGPEVSNPAEMLNSESFTRIIEKVADKYDRILVDSPPVVAVTDALILAALCDVTVLVLRAQSSTRKISVQARESLAGVDARILGVIINDVSHRSGRYGYYSRYGYYYHYDYSGGGRKKTQKGRERKTTSASAQGAIAETRGEAADGVVRL
jgi:capsular exopolysaccharide synthesis family protein